MLKKLLSQSEKVAKCNFKSKLKYMKNVSSNEMKCFFASAEDRFHVFELFCRKKSF